MAMKTDPFTPRTPLSRAMLEAYALGTLNAEERHEVELRLERDPLLREAMEGLAMPGAVPAFHAMPKPGFSSTWNLTVPLTAAVLLIGGVAWYWSASDPIKQQTGTAVEVQQRRLAEPAVIPAVVESTLQVVHAEIDAREKLEPYAETKATVERFQNGTPADRQLERESIERIDAHPVALDRTPDAAAPHAAHNPRTSRHLVFLHELKLVHPDELYSGKSPRLYSLGVPANVDMARQEADAQERSTQRYLDFMDGAMGDIARGEDRAALDEFYFLLNQYPEDVNAQFYAGLACHRLGLFPRALRFLHAAALNPVDSFNEEAVWYEALAAEKLDGADAARPAFERIAKAGGFYAVQAKKKLAGED